MKRKITALSLAAAMLMLLPACSEEPIAPLPDSPLSVSADVEKPLAGDDFYGYVNYESIQNGQLPNGRSSYSTFDKLGDRIDEEIDEILDDCLAKEWKKDTPQQRIKDLFELYADTDAREKEGIELLKPGIGLIQNAKTMSEFIEATGALYRMYGVRTFFIFRVSGDLADSSKNKLFFSGVNCLGLSREDITESDTAMDDIGGLVQDTLLALDVDGEKAKSRAIDVVKLIDRIGEASMPTMDYSDFEKIYNPCTYKEFQELFSNIDTGKLIEAYGFSPDDLVVSDIGQAKCLNEVLKDGSNLDAMKDYAISCFVQDYQSVFPPSYVKKMTASQEKSDEKNKDTRDFVKNILCDDFGVLYGRKICTDERMKAASEMMEDIRAAYRRLINSCDRLSADSKNKFLKKLDNMVVLIGYDERTVSDFEVVPLSDGGSLLSTYIGAQQAAVMKMEQKIHQKPDRTEWGMKPQEVNAEYNPTANNICLPAALLDPYYFDPDNKYKSLGMVGYVMAHEITHGFDADGFRYDENGCSDDEWLCEEDRESYQKLLDRAKDYYSNFKLLDVYNVNGEQTLSENIADLGAVQCIAEIPETKEQRKQLFEGVAEQWCAIEVVSSVVDQLYSDVHSPGEARVNAVVSCIDKFYEAYDIRETDKMYVAPEKRIKVW